MDRADPARARLLIENNAGMGGCVGARFEEIRLMMDAVRDPRIGAGLDTCHAFASGYHERTPMAASATLDAGGGVGGLERVEVIRTNDPQRGLGCSLYRDAKVGQGEIGEAGFRALLHDPRLQRVPFILEVPGFDGKGPDAANMEILRRLAG